MKQYQKEIEDLRRMLEEGSPGDLLLILHPLIVFLVILLLLLLIFFLTLFQFTSFLFSFIFFLARRD